MTDNTIMGNSHIACRSKIIQEQNIAGVRCMYPLYNTSYSNPSLDYKMQVSFALQDHDKDLEKYLYTMNKDVWDKHKNNGKPT